jgi:hypothetical protein
LSRIFPYPSDLRHGATDVSSGEVLPRIRYARDLVLWPAIRTWRCGVGAVVAVVIAWLAILLTGRYPRGLFGFVVGVSR